jgi:hypothetical protein
MSELYYNRYGNFLIEGQQTVVPYVELQNKPSDKVYIYRTASSRLDKISQMYYGSPLFGWLIMMANPQFGGLEWNITDGSVLRIPFPLISSLQDYKTALDNYFYYYGR